jgi:hypothetical protein
MTVDFVRLQRSRTDWNAENKKEMIFRDKVREQVLAPAIPYGYNKDCGVWVRLKVIRTFWVQQWHDLTYILVG